MSSSPVLTVSLPEPFVWVPTATSAELSSWADEMVALGRASATTLASLTAAIEKAEDSDRSWFAILPPAPYIGGIAAFGWLQGGRANGLTAAAMQAATETDVAARGGSSLVVDMSMHAVGVLPALVLHQFQPVGSADSSVLVERCGALLLDEARDVVVSIDITAVDLSAASDLVGLVLGILTTLNFGMGPR